ncbi:MAG TPA: FecR domain-containing protein [Agriterribacter sp.]|nr:FecR domain-containing protein [Agriterribacter sp.]
MIQNEFARLLTRKLSGEATPEELQQFEQWIKEHPENQFFVETMQSYWTSSHPAQVEDPTPDEHFLRIIDKAESDSPWPSAEKHTNQVSKVLRLKQWWIAAAMLGLLFLGSRWLWVNYAQPKQQKEVSEIFAARGVKSHLFLPDGSSVWLNSDSKIYYDKRFNGATREVTLDGEAFFKVVKNKKRPFIVHTSAIDIKVLGTSFNVKAYKTDPTIETTLITGSVEIENKIEPGQSKILLKPKEKLIYSKLELDQPVSSSEISKPEKTKKPSGVLVKTLPPGIADTAFAETSWVHNRLIYDGDSFSELAKKMERWFNVQIVFKNKAVSEARLVGAFEDETIEQALQALQMITPFNFNIKGSMVEIY